MQSRLLLNLTLQVCRMGEYSIAPKVVHKSNYPDLDVSTRYLGYIFEGWQSKNLVHRRFKVKVQSHYTAAAGTIRL